MKIQDVMTTDVLTVDPEASLKDVAANAEHRVSGLPVVDGDAEVVGVVSEADILLKEVGRQERPAGRHRLARKPGGPANSRREPPVRP